MRAIVVSIIAGSLFFTSVQADHEPDHRYNIRGYVLDASQQGIDKVTVQAFAEGKLLGSSETNADGYYSMHLHLHNADYHRTLKLRAGSQEAELRVTFDRGDNSSARIHEANFVAGKYVEGSLGRFRVPTWLYVAGGLLTLGAIVVILERRRKKKIRQKIEMSTDNQPVGKRKSKKKRRKKR